MKSLNNLVTVSWNRVTDDCFVCFMKWIIFLLSVCFSKPEIAPGGQPEMLQNKRCFFVIAQLNSC